MSDATAGFDLKALAARIDRDIAETGKLNAETRKFVAEHDKLQAEEKKLGRDRLLAPWLAIVGLIGGVITIASTIARWKGWGG